MSLIAGNLPRSLWTRLGVLLVYVYGSLLDLSYCTFLFTCLLPLKTLKVPEDQELYWSAVQFLAYNRSIVNASVFFSLKMAKYTKYKTFLFNRLSVQISRLKFSHIIVQLSLLSIFRTFLSSQTETLYPLNNNPLASSPQLLVTTILLFSLCIWL